MVVAKPEALPIRAEGIPEELKVRPQWVNWRFEERGEDWTKVPYTPGTQRRASSTDLLTWGTFANAIAALERMGFDGVGFMFGSGDPYCGVDLDGCRDPKEGEIEEWATGIVEELDSYSEASPSRTGVHVIAKGTLPPGGRKRGGIEVYDTERFFTMTGEHLEGTPETVEERPDALSRLHRRVFGEPAEVTNGCRNGGANNGLSDEEIIARAMRAKNGAQFARLWAGDLNDHPSASEADFALCSRLAFWTGGDPVAMDRLFRRSGLYRPKWDERHFGDGRTYGQATIGRAFEGASGFYDPGSPSGGDARGEGENEGGSDTEEPSGGREPTQAELLTRYADRADLSHTPAGDAYATIPVGDHRETYPIKSRGFKRYLVREFYEDHARPPRAQALQDALGLLEARAQFDGPEREVHVRVAGHKDAIYVDLTNERWEAVEITASGWRVVPGDAAPVRFRRPRGMSPLPAPKSARDGRDDLDDLLHRFINVPDAASLRLIVAWLVQAFRSTGPYPILVLLGEQGSAKSTAERLLRSLVDPSTAPLRTTPRNERDLMIAATNSWVVAFDNISTLTPWCSDALCRLSTGGGFSARELYTDAEEVLFDATRPVILNGITDVATRPDLLDRALVVALPPIPEEERKAEAKLWREFEQARPSILAALFDAVAGALGTVEGVRLEGMPRMADFAQWATAAESALGWAQGDFMQAYTGNRAEAAETALEADPVAGAVRRLMRDREEWKGTATVLWQALGELVDEDVRRTKAWPGGPNALAGHLKRLAPALRGVGIEYSEPSRVGKSGSRMKKLRKI